MYGVIIMFTCQPGMSLHYIFTLFVSFFLINKVIIIMLLAWDMIRCLSSKCSIINQRP